MPDICKTRSIKAFLAFNRFGHLAVFVPAGSAIHSDSVLILYLPSSRVSFLLVYSHSQPLPCLFVLRDRDTQDKDRRNDMKKSSQRHPPTSRHPLTPSQNTRALQPCPVSSPKNLIPSFREIIHDSCTNTRKNTRIVYFFSERRSSPLVSLESLADL